MNEELVSCLLIFALGVLTGVLTHAILSGVEHHRWWRWFRGRHHGAVVEPEDL